MLLLTNRILIFLLPKYIDRISAPTPSKCPKSLSATPFTSSRSWNERRKPIETGCSRYVSFESENPVESRPFQLCFGLAKIALTALYPSWTTATRRSFANLHFSSSSTIRPSKRRLRSAMMDWISFGSAGSKISSLRRRCTRQVLSG